MPDIVLTTLNAKYAHAAFGLRYLLANMGPLRDRTALLEFDINQRPLDVAEKILALSPKVVGLGVYIWNADQATQLVACLKRIRPDLIVILGGPEVSYETDQQDITRLADYTISGEADLAFGELCGRLLSGGRPLMRTIAAELPEFDRIELPYDLYDEKDLAHRVVYVEASRGCPFTCEFCLSSLDIPVRQAPLEKFLAAMQSLLDRGLRRFKFVDRTFNLNLKVSQAILRFFLERYEAGLFLHFEMIPDRLPEALRDQIKQFPPGALQFEVGIQTFNDDVAELISRRQDNAKVEDNLRFLRDETGVHVHADLIAGLPGEDLDSFAAGFDRLLALNPQEIQVGILKRLRGTPIVRHDAAWKMVYAAHPPYEVLSTKRIDFPTMQRLRRFARFWDLIANSGNFLATAPLIWTPEPSPRMRSSHGASAGSPFHSFMRFSDWLYTRTNQTHAIALPRLTELLATYLIEQLHLDRAEVLTHLRRDYTRLGRGEPPLDSQRDAPAGHRSKLPRRQARHAT